MAITAIKKFFSGVKPIILLFATLLTSLYLMSDATLSTTQFGRLYSILLSVNALASILLIGLIIKNLAVLISQYRKRTTGSRLTTRLVILFAILSVTPVSVVYYFSLNFLQRGIDSWFDVRIENALDDALELSKASLGVRMRELLRQTQQASQSLSTSTIESTTLSLTDLRTTIDASELTLFDQKEKILASSSIAAGSLIPEGLDKDAHSRVRLDKEYVSTLLLHDSLYIRVAIEVPSPDPVAEPLILQALFAVTERVNKLVESVQGAFSQYRELIYLRKPLKTTFIITLSLVLLLSLLMAIWAAFYFARRLVQPITDLVEGTKAVAEGNYKKRLPLLGKDELGVLVRSFNDMTHKISMVTAEANRSQQQLAEQHAYLEIVLAHLSSGVMTLDHDRHLHTSNSAANQILNLNLENYEGLTLKKLSTDHPHTLLFIDMIFSHLDNDEKDWREEITIFNQTGRQVLLCRGSELPGTDTEHGGHIIVFDDITNLVQAQRNAAWGEVARRLAHEIKNPLTPIQLSAERLRRKYLDKMQLEDAELLDRSTHTIVQQVETLKTMVKSFSDYARMPMLQLTPTDINEVINEVLDLYRGEATHCEFHIQLDQNMPKIDVDIGRLRQLLHNLLKNAMEAMEEQDNPTITIQSECMEKEACRFIELRVQDNGPGIPDELIGQLFDPYITTKPKGTGLGLAIVKKIVEEHGGMIWVENIESGGAVMIIRLPVSRNEREMNNNRHHERKHAAA